MAIPHSELQKINPSSIIELFELTTVAALHGSATTYRFHAGTDGVLTGVNAHNDIHWNGNTYTRLPIEASGFEYTSKQNPRPTIAISNLFGTISTILANVNTTTVGNDLTGATLTRIRTMLRYLPNDNFTGNNPYGTPDNTQEFPREIFLVARKSLETRNITQFELSASTDQAGVKLPKRRFLPDEFKGIGDFF